MGRTCADTATTLYTDNGGTPLLVGTCQLTDTWDLVFVRVIRPLVTFGGGDGGTMRGNSKLIPQGRKKALTKNKQ